MPKFPLLELASPLHILQCVKLLFRNCHANNLCFNLEPNYPTMVNRHLHICHDVAYRHLSPEEIRLADYHSGRKYGGPHAVAQLHLPPTVAVQDSAAIYQLQMPPPIRLSVGGSWSSSPGSDTSSKFQGALLSSTTSQIPAGSQASSSFGGASISTPTGSSAFFGQASLLTNPLSRASPWGAGNNSFANPPNTPSTPVSSAATQKLLNIAPPPQQPTVTATVPKTQSSPTPSSSAPTTPGLGLAQTVDTSASGLTGFAKYATQPPHPSTSRPLTDRKSVLTGASVFGSPAAQSDKASTPKPSELTGFAKYATQSENASSLKLGTTGTSVFGSPAAQSPSASTPAPVLSIFNQSQLYLKTRTPSFGGSSISMSVTSSSGPLVPGFPPLKSSSAPPSQNLAPRLGGFGSTPTITNPKLEEKSLEVIPKSGKFRDVVEEEVAHQEALLNLCILAEILCWPKLFNAAIDAYVQGEFYPELFMRR